MASDSNQSPVEAEFVAAIESGPLTEVEVREAPDGTGLIITAVAVDPDTSDEVPVSITLDPGGADYVVMVAREEIVVPRDRPAEQERSSKNSRQVGALRKLHEFATRLEQEAKGKARELAERLRLKRSA